MATQSRFPGIEKAATEISYDNGGINRDRSEEAMLRHLRRYLSTIPYYDELSAIDNWLGALNADDLDTVCAGEQTEMEDLLANAPPFTGQLLIDIFENVG
jgi:hypothetical protein